MFLVLAGLFLGTLAMLNILGISRFIKLFETTTSGGTPLVFAIAIGVLPYPMTFLCTDFICEFYGRKRANHVVFVGLLLNIWVVAIIWLGGVLPGFETIDPITGAIARDAAGRLPVFFEIRALTFGAVTASMIAYMAAQFCDVYVFHFWKKVTKGRLLWVRNNGSTMVSQLVDTTAVILITHYFAHALPIDPRSPSPGNWCSSSSPVTPSSSSSPPSTPCPSTSVSTTSRAISSSTPPSTTISTAADEAVRQ